MPTAQEYRHQAAECLQLARESTELYVKSALLELAAEFHRLAEELERQDTRRAEPHRRSGIG